MNMKYYPRTIVLTCLLFTLSGCGTFFNQPVTQQRARTGEITPQTSILSEFPEPSEPVYVGVYNFRDQTGQFKALENGSTFSTAVTQGATTILIKALEDSKWFIPVERENISNLLNERNIIEKTRKQYNSNQNDPNEPALPPLKYAGILLEGAIVSYDTNIITGGAGARYFGVGGSTQYREDRLTVYLRAVSTSSGRILKSVYVSKTILSQAVNASLFKYVNFQRLLEVETGYTKNEPVQLAVKEAIEKAVEALIIEGIQEKLWAANGGADLNQELIDTYLAEKKFEESTRLYERELIEKPTTFSLEAGGGVTYFDGDFSQKRLAPLGSVGLSKRLTPNFIAGINFKYLEFKGGQDFSTRYFSGGLNIEYDLLPEDALSPFAYLGGGYLLDGARDDAPFINYGAGLSLRLNEKLSLRLYGEQNVSFSDNIEGLVNGKRDDFFFNFGAGVRYHFKKRDRVAEVPETPEIIEE